MVQLPAQPDHCELCGRPVADLTKHHLIPRRLHRKKHFQRKFAREEMLSRILWVCRPCHNAIHRARNEQQLGMHYNTRERLLEIPELQEFVQWLQDKPAGFVPKRHRRYRR
ncbi:hypothetical protein QQM79_06805 [Marinobacteraceae bacterium S3BR75-40.1]